MDRTAQGGFFKNADFDTWTGLARDLAARGAQPQLVFSLAVPVVIIVYMLKFTKSYPDRVAHNEAVPG